MASAATQVTGADASAWLLFLGERGLGTAVRHLVCDGRSEDDLRAGAKSTAILFGESELSRRACSYALFLATLLLVGLHAQLAHRLLRQRRRSPRSWSAGVPLRRGRDRDGILQGVLAQQLGGRDRVRRLRARRDDSMMGRRPIQARGRPCDFETPHRIFRRRRCA